MAEQLTLFDPEVLRSKWADLSTPGAVVEVDPQEAAAMGAFVEDALSEDDALQSSCDLYSGWLFPEGV